MLRLLASCLFAATLAACAIEIPARAPSRTDPSNPDAPEAPLPAASTALTGTEPLPEEAPPESPHGQMHVAPPRSPADTNASDGGATQGGSSRQPGTGGMQMGSRDGGSR